MINEEYLKILTGTLKFVEDDHIWIMLSYVVAVIVLTIIISKQFKKAKRFDKVAMCSVAFLFVVILCMYLSFYYSFTNKLTSDISNNEFVTYTGKFTHDNYQSDSFAHYIYINQDIRDNDTLIYPDYGNMYKLRSNDRRLPLGDSEGTLIYGKSSRVVVDWILE